MSSQEGFAHWRNMLAEVALPTRIEAAGSGNFSAEIRAQAIGEIGLVDGICHQDFAVQSSRGKAEIARSDDRLMLYLQGSCRESSLEYRHFGRVTLRPGNWVLLGPSDVFTWRTEHSIGHFQLLTLPADGCHGLPPVPADCYGRCMASHHLPNKLVANYIQTLAAGGPIADAATRDAVARNLMQLITLAAGADRASREACHDGLESGLLHGLMRHLDAHYADAALSPSAAAARLGISLRHLHRLCERAGTTFCEELYQRRLRHAHRLLRGKLHRHRTITEIAYESGFSDLSHFARRYRAMYGEAPGGSRRAAA